MIRNIVLFAAASLALIGPAMASPTSDADTFAVIEQTKDWAPDKKITIFADNSNVCGYGRIANQKKDDNVRTASNLVYALRSAGHTNVQLVVRHAGIVVATFNRTPILTPSC